MAAPSWNAKYLDGEDPTDLHAMLVAYYGDAPVTKLKAVPAGNGETMSFFYARVQTPYLMTPTHKYLVVAVLRNRDPPFQAGLRRLSVLMGCSPQYCIGRVDRVIGPTSQSPRAPFGIWALSFIRGISPWISFTFDKACYKA